MTHLTPPPKVSRRMMIGMAALLAILAFAVVLLTCEELLPPVLRDFSRALRSIEPEESAQQQEAFNEYQANEVQQINKTITNPHYRKQLTQHANSAESEQQYLILRQWSVWHLALPFVLIIVGIIWWQAHKRRQ